ncbi:MAG: hypothetical protein DRP95_01305 [Candidatus Latescibacterota bacterium]|nr:MAG: hypothetical protein DRP95_01305 [Candidatus Latescibacterota bacterium]
MILIDGHNLIGRLPGLSLEDPDDEEKLLRLLSRYRGRMKGRIFVAFDPGVGVGPSLRSIGGIQVAYARNGSTADSLILERISRMRNPQEALVISSDRGLGAQARALGARVMSAEEFAEKFLTSPQKPPPEKPDGPVDVEEWLEIFGEGLGGGNPPRPAPGLTEPRDGRARPGGDRGTGRLRRG